MHMLDDLHEKFPVVRSLPARNRFPTIAKGPERDSVDLPCRRQALQEVQDFWPTKHVEIAAGIFSRKRRIVRLEKRDRPEIDRLAADDRRRYLAAGNDPVIVGISRI